ncbi:MAG: methyltransferase domain-containing protein [Deltaproteobacteria bacterium]|nr:methyltransferase domain-containing protein [Deltaproteobacteria bacterium]
MINQLIRYEPALRFMEMAGHQRLCEVGSGQNGICKFLDQDVTGIDIDFRDYQSGSGTDFHPRLTPVFGDILKGTNFADGEFDVVLCVDMLEHVAKADRPRAIKEILRMSKRAYIALPVGARALAADRWLDEVLRRIGRVPPAWLREHFDAGFPVDGEIEHILDSMPQFEYDAFDNDNILFHKFVVFLEIVRFAHLSDRISRWKIARPLMRLFNGGDAYRRVYLVTRR